MLGPQQLLLSLAILNIRVFALQVTPGSSCSAVCLNDTEADPLDAEASSTDISEIACHDAEYDSTSTGIKYRNCLDCLQKSNTTQGAESDAEWFLYNLRYSVDICVYGFPNASKRVSSPCDIDTACEPLKKAMEAGDLDPNRDQYEYCTTDGDYFSGQSLDPCVQCLSTSSDLSYMANFMTALKAGCDQKPKGGNLLGLAGSLFTNSRINITDPPSNQTVTADSGSSSAMTQGTIVGIAVGAALLFFGGIGLFWVYHRKQKRLYGYGEPVHSDYDPRGGGGSKSITPPPLLGGIGGGGIADPHKLAAMSQVSEYELRSQLPPRQPPPLASTSTSRYYRPPANNAEYYDELEKEMFSFRPANAGPKPTTTTTTTTNAAATISTMTSTNHHNNYAFNPNVPGSGAQGAKLPTHPAYDPAASHSRQSSNHSTRSNYIMVTAPLEPPRPARRTNKPDSYALAAYLNAAEDANNHTRLPGPLPGPPSGPPPTTTTTTTSSTIAAAAASIAIAEHQQQQQIQQQLQQRPAPPPPPPPPRTAKVPALRLPSVPRIRVPKKYAPPQIRIEGPTPVEQTTVDRRRPWVITGEVEPKSGESSLYG